MTLRQHAALHSRPNGKREQGTALLEFALGMIVLMALLFGVFEVAHAFYAYSFVSNAARDGTRYAMVRGSACRSWMSACPASSTDVQNFVQSTTMPGLDPSAVTVTTTWTPNKDPGSVVQVSVQYRFSFMVPFIPLSSTVMTSSSRMVISQ